MNRWIDGNWLLNFFEPYPDDYQTPLGTLRACVDDAPLLDLVRCAECKHAHLTYDGEVKYCNIWFPNDSMYLSKDYYCADGERKESE